MVILGAPALVTVGVGAAPRQVGVGAHQRCRHGVAGRPLLLALGAVTTSAASNAMFLSSHDYRLFLVVLVLSSGIALAVGSHLTQPAWPIDIARLGEVAERVAAGDLTARTGVSRG